MNDDGRRPRLYRRQPKSSDIGNIAAFLIAFALIVAIALTLFVGLGAVLPGS
jgi:hypothetical protein